MVLGHEGCGAVGAALRTRDDGQLHHSRIQLLVEEILPGLPQFDPQLSLAVRLNQAVESNVHWTIAQILSTPEGRTREAEGQLKIVGAIYEMASGRVRFLKTK